MKKTIMTLTLVLAVAFISTNAMAWGMNGGNGNCYNMNNNNGVNSQVDPQVYQDFMNSTVKLRATIDADRAEIAALMASPTPDATRVRALTEQINEKFATLNQKATTLNLPTYGMMGSGMMKRSMRGRGMRGSNGNRNGYGCNW
ncbi:zinc resistance-associated protein [Maridesulfovibrio ferrireducens]|uniref:Zinc resistance-associated protein n=1 Tax=Maridesulfovibrio ferrireducens TaxID=246191 RepID=A0A1G9IC73_9BACT|nr:hypothetical protein [Maridesulfovibrio ferrireducens]SDL22732.1 zinc resistance-associated protein [Maridesulfovibrio ferrireducens]